MRVLTEAHRITVKSNPRFTELLFRIKQISSHGTRVRAKALGLKNSNLVVVHSQESLTTTPSNLKWNLNWEGGRWLVTPSTFVQTAKIHKDYSDGR